MLQPCAFYDLERLESWLQDMAARGFHQRQGRMVGKFEKGAPKAVRYRLQTKGKWYLGRTPDSDMEELFRDMGWEFVTAHGDFYIFRTEDENAPELNTEPKLMAQGFRGLMWSWAFNVLLYSMLLWVNIGRMALEPCRFFVTFGPVYTVGFAIMLLAAVLSMAYRCVQLIRYYRRLKQAKELDHRRPWKKGALYHQISGVSFFVLWLLVMVLMLGNIFVESEKTDITQYPGKPPIVTVNGLYPTGQYTRQEIGDSYNYYSEHENVVAKMLEWRELADVVTPEGERVHGVLIVQYYELKSQWLAEGLTRELEKSIRKNDRYEPIELPNLGLDYVSGYEDIGLRVILRQGNTVLDVTLYEEIAQPWLEKMAEMLK